jgi:hypothetical protein
MLLEAQEYTLLHRGMVTPLVQYIYLSRYSIYFRPPYIGTLGNTTPVYYLKLTDILRPVSIGFT